MPLLNRFYCASLLLAQLWSLTTLGQPSASDTSLNPPIREYHRFLNPEAGLYRGVQYITYAHLLKEGHPYFAEGRPLTGSILYNGVQYENIPILYDQVKEVLVINDNRGVYKIALVSLQIDSFTLENHRFFNNTDSIHSYLRVGFYQILHQGRTTLLKRERKMIRSQIDYLTVNQYIDYTVDYYLKKDGAWYTVNNERSLLHAFGDNKPALKKFLRAQGVKFRKDKENTLLRSADWYESQHQ